MLSKRSVPAAVVIPVLSYPAVNRAAAWLSDAFGFSVRLRIGTHRVQLNVGEGAVILHEIRPSEVNQPLGIGHSVLIRVEDVDSPLRKPQENTAQKNHAGADDSSIRREAI